MHDKVGRVEGGQNTECKGFHERERREEHEVPRVAVALPVEQAEVNKGSEKRDVERPLAKSGQ